MSDHYTQMAAAASPPQERLSMWLGSLIVFLGLSAAVAIRDNIEVGRSLASMLDSREAMHDAALQPSIG
jgi:hypothetical protein